MPPSANPSLPAPPVNGTGLVLVVDPAPTLALVTCSSDDVVVPCVTVTVDTPPGPTDGHVDCAELVVRVRMLVTVTVTVCAPTELVEELVLEREVEFEDVVEVLVLVWDVLGEELEETEEDAEDPDEELDVDEEGGDVAHGM